MDCGIGCAAEDKLISVLTFSERRAGEYSGHQLREGTFAAGTLFQRPEEEVGSWPDVLCYKI